MSTNSEFVNLTTRLTFSWNYSPGKNMTLKEYISRLYGRRTYELTGDLKRVKCKLARISNQLIFLKRCRDNFIIPKGLRLKNKTENERSSNILREAERKLLINQINALKRDKATGIRRRNELGRKLNDDLTSNDSSLISRVTDASANREFLKSRSSLVQKYNRLVTERDRHRRVLSRTETQLNVVENISDKHLTEHELAVLNKGLAFAPTPKSIPVKEIICAVEAALDKSNEPREANRTRAKIAYVLDKARRKPIQDNLSSDERRALSSLTSRDDISIVPKNTRKKYRKKIPLTHRYVTFNRYSTHGDVAFIEMQHFLLPHLIAAMQASARFYWYVSAVNFTYFAECSIFALNATFFAIFTHHALGALGRKRIPIIDIRLAYNPVPKKIPSFAGYNFYLAILLAPWAKQGLYAMDWVWKKWHRIRTYY